MVALFCVGSNTLMRGHCDSPALTACLVEPPNAKKA
jgi:hypothetical protein